MLSGSTHGRAIPIAATATPGTLIHTATSDDKPHVYDEVYLRASNVTGTAATLTLEWGGVGNPSDHVVKAYSIPANSQPVSILAGERLRNGLVIRAFSGTANAINVFGFVNRKL
jgi:hypothetical protein